MKKVGIIVGGFIILLGIMIGVFALTLRNNMATIRAIPVAEVYLDTVEDGTYRGSYYYEDQIGATLDVVVVDHEITDIVVVEHLSGKGAIAEDVLDDIITTQTLDVDDVAGATTSSHILKLALQDALEDNE